MVTHDKLHRGIPHLEGADDEDSPTELFSVYYIAVAAAAAAAKSLHSCPTLCDPIDGSPPDSLSLGLSRQEHWSGVPFPLMPFY